MFEIKSIDHIVLRTTQLDKMLFFYCDVLGCVIENKQEAIKLTQLRVGDNLIDLLVVDESIQAKHRNLEHFCLRIAPFNYPQLKAYFEKYEIEAKHFGNRYGSKGMGDSFYISDPEGNEVELCELKG